MGLVVSAVTEASWFGIFTNSVQLPGPVYALHVRLAYIREKRPESL